MPNIELLAKAYRHRNPTTHPFEAIRQVVAETGLEGEQAQDLEAELFAFVMETKPPQSEKGPKAEPTEIPQNEVEPLLDFKTLGTPKGDRD